MDVRKKEKAKSVEERNVGWSRAKRALRHIALGAGIMVTGLAGTGGCNDIKIDIYNNGPCQGAPKNTESVKNDGGMTPDAKKPLQDTKAKSQDTKPETQDARHETQDQKAPWQDGIVSDGLKADSTNPDVTALSVPGQLCKTSYLGPTASKWGITTPGMTMISGIDNDIMVVLKQYAKGTSPQIDLEILRKGVSDGIFNIFNEYHLLAIPGPNKIVIMRFVPYQSGQSFEIYSGEGECTPKFNLLKTCMGYDQNYTATIYEGNEVKMSPGGAGTGIAIALVKVNKNNFTATVEISDVKSGKLIGGKAIEVSLENVILLTNFSGEAFVLRVNSTGYDVTTNLGVVIIRGDKCTESTLSPSDGGIALPDGGITSNDLGAIPDKKAAQTPSTGSIGTSSLPYSGDDKAPVRIELVTNHACTFCIELHDKVLPTLTTNYVDKGKLRLGYRFLPFVNVDSTKAAVHAAYCAAGQGTTAADRKKNFNGMNDLLYSNVTAWYYGAVSALATIFDGYAKSLGLDAAKFSSCYSSKSYQTQIDADIQIADKHGITGIPTGLMFIPVSMTTTSALNAMASGYQIYNDGKNYLIVLTGSSRASGK